ncbi:MAG: hypothetical protein ACHQIK_16145 [Candidatus Acidiferrales bacterium]
MYYDKDEFVELAGLFDVELKNLYHDWKWLPVAAQLILAIDHGNHREFLTQILEQLRTRNLNAIARTDWERRTAHQNLEEKIRSLKDELGDPTLPRELAVAENKPFAAKSEIREFLENAETEVFVVDPYVGVGTLDCFRNTKQPIRLLAGERDNSIEAGFDKALEDFRKEGFTIEVRRHPKLHDRHITFNDRCWLVGSSLKDAGNKSLHVMEIVDAKQVVLISLEAKWGEGKAYR